VYVVVVTRMVINLSECRNAGVAAFLFMKLCRGTLVCHRSVAEVAAGLEPTRVGFWVPFAGVEHF